MYFDEICQVHCDDHKKKGNLQIEFKLKIPTFPGFMEPWVLGQNMVLDERTRLEAIRFSQEQIGCKKFKMAK